MRERGVQVELICYPSKVPEKDQKFYKFKVQYVIYRGNGLFLEISHSLADFGEHSELVGSTFRPLKDVSRLVADEPDGRPTLQIVVLGDQGSP